MKPACVCGSQGTLVCPRPTLNALEGTKIINFTKIFQTFSLICKNPTKARPEVKNPIYTKIQIDTTTYIMTFSFLDAFRSRTPCSQGILAGLNMFQDILVHFCLWFLEGSFYSSISYLLLTSFCEFWRKRRVKPKLGDHNNSPLPVTLRLCASAKETW